MAGEVPLWASRHWGTCAMLTEVGVIGPDGRERQLPLPTVAIRLTRRDEPREAVIVLVPEALVDDIDVDIWPIVKRRASAMWGWRTRRLRAAQRA